MEPRIILRNLVKIYDGRLSEALGASVGTEEKAVNNRTAAVDNVLLTIQNRDRLGIIGPNGAGKSTLLHLIAGLCQPTSGEVNVTGKVTSIMTLGLGLREHLSGRENIYIDGEVQGRTREEIDAVIDEVIAFADLGEFINYPVRTYSTGMKARLAFAMITCIEPEILIIDEALSAGDNAFASKATRKIQDLCAAGKIVILVSHSMSSIRAMCNRCLWMEKGKVIKDGHPTEVTEAYLNAVHRADEEVLLKKFRSQIGVKSFQQGCVIKSMEFCSSGSDKPKSILNSRENIILKIDVEANPELDLRLRFIIQRLDGLLLTNVVVDVQRDNEKAFCIQAEFEPLILSYGVYKASAELVSGIDSLLAKCSTVFEVMVQDPPHGGRPALNYDHYLSVQQL